MKKYFFGALPLFVLCLSSCSQVETAIGIDFVHGTFEEALQLAEEEEKLVFVDVYTSWCGPCKVMSQTVFPDEEVGEYFNARFVSYKLDAEDLAIDGPRISNTYDVSAFPTLLFLNPDGSELGRGVSGYDIDGLLGLAEDILSEQSKNPERLAELSTQYEAGDRNKDLVQEYLHVASLVSASTYGSETSYELARKMQPIFDEYIETHSNEVATLINGKDFQLIRGYAARRPKSHPAVALVVENFDSFAEVVPEFALCYFVVETNYSTVIDLAQAGDPSYKNHIALLDTELAHAHSVIAAEDPSNAILKDQLGPRAKTQYLIGTNDWDGYIAEVDAKLEQAADDVEKARIKGRAASWLMNSGDEEFVQLGDEYATTAYNADKTQPVNVLNYSSVLIKSGQLEDALDVYEEMLSTLDPSHPNYNFKNALEASMARVKAMMDESSENESDSETNIDT
ncbi:MAG: thioredoxin family protein [Gammaproteobacteria bacterium]|nr:thioredoxin family protein [Gammaproteobacteria bacterium]MYF02645.1 thioredoxin family protein [Gammaproteobacteria bacterium]MYI76768.1 thioredoxin family protein [Gammaproteobacteria bacterium]